MIPSKILNTTKTDYESNPVFLGEQDQGLFDTIHKNHPNIWGFYKEIRSLDWSEDEFGNGKQIQWLADSCLLS